MYVCGITPYDATHLGHAATYVAFDLLNRAWRNAGHRVRYVQNVTDVDDPLLERADATGEDWMALAERETDLFRADMTALRVLPPDHYVGAVESIPLVNDYIERLRALGAIYPVERDWYFAVNADPNFGGVSGLDQPAMVEIFSQRGGDPDRAGKRASLDCLVWRAERTGEPSWEGPLGPGRPGWHIECTAIAQEHLGLGFDVQGGGSDLVFPHHEMCASQAVVANAGSPFAGSYVHAGMVAYDGEKMSKSRGNLVFVSVLRASGVNPMAIRLALLGHHYRDDWEWHDSEIAVAETRLAQWASALTCADGPPVAATISGVLAALANDLDAPTALATIQDWVDETLARPASALPATADEGAGLALRDLLDAALGITI
jgi:L-cysteine:1D-myo-inositol 2-amino-2-deoxy-alpha-D-glucopyranoside ligase